MRINTRDALRRELYEELGVDATVGAEVVSFEFLPPVCAETTLLRFYRATIHGEPRPLVAQGIGWFTHAELAALTMTPGNRAALHVLREEVLR